MNKSILMGRLTANPELKTTSSGLSVTSFTVAINRDYAKAGAEREADFIDCVAWRERAEFITKYFSKGSMIAIEGTLQTRTYTDKNGNNRKAVEVLVEKAHFCGSKKDNASNNTANSTGADQSGAVPDTSNINVDFDIDDNDLPF